MNEPPARAPEPEKHWLQKVGKALLFLAAGTVVLAVLAFGTCLLLFKM